MALFAQKMSTFASKSYKDIFTSWYIIKLLEVFINKTIMIVIRRIYIWPIYRNSAKSDIEYKEVWEVLTTFYSRFGEC